MYDSASETGRRGCVWIRNSGPSLKFHYWRDRLFLFCCALYALNRWGLKPRLHSAFLRDHFDDLLLIPCALPLLLWFQRRLGLRPHDQLPGVGEIALYVLVWSILFEVIGPRIMPWTVGDPWDAVSYAVGGLLAGVWWHRHRGSGLVLAREL